MSAYLPDVVVDNHWLFGGLAAGAVGLHGMCLSDQALGSWRCV
jgi:hypothetical protein